MSRRSNNLASTNPAPPVQSGRSLSAEIARAERPGLVAAARINSGAFATSVAIHHAAMLSQSADVAFRISPMGENVYRAIFAAFGNFAVTEINRLSFYDGEQS
jgi:hypothetical protein